MKIRRKSTLKVEVRKVFDEAHQQHIVIKLEDINRSRAFPQLPMTFATQIMLENYQMNAKKFFPRLCAFVDDSIFVYMPIV